jgi:hypothetical protein
MKIRIGEVYYKRSSGAQPRRGAGAAARRGQPAACRVAAPPRPLLSATFPLFSLFSPASLSFLPRCHGLACLASRARPACMHCPVARPGARRVCASAQGRNSCASCPATCREQSCGVRGAGAVAGAVVGLVQDARGARRRWQRRPGSAPRDARCADSVGGSVVKAQSRVRCATSFPASVTLPDDTSAISCACSAASRPSRATASASLSASAPVILGPASPVFCIAAMRSP